MVAKGTHVCLSISGKFPRVYSVSYVGRVYSAVVSFLPHWMYVFVVCIHELVVVYIVYECLLLGDSDALHAGRLHG